MKVAYDMTKMRPACALVAASMGASTAAASQFDTEDWLLIPTKNMKVYETTEIQLNQLVTLTRLARKK